MSPAVILAISCTPAMLTITVVLILRRRRTWRAVCTCGHTTMPCTTRGDAVSAWRAHRAVTMRSQCSTAASVRTRSIRAARREAARVTERVRVRS